MVLCRIDGEPVGLGEEDLDPVLEVDDAAQAASAKTPRTAESFGFIGSKMSREAGWLAGLSKKGLC